MLINGNNDEIDCRSVYLGDNMSNNVAEYYGLINGLLMALKRGERNILSSLSLLPLSLLPCLSIVMAGLVLTLVMVVA